MSRTFSYSNPLPHALYRAEQVRNLDRAAIDGQGIPGLTLMERAGSAAFDLMRELWPSAEDITLLCGIGNNGGDGYVVARLALEAGFKPRMLVVGDPGRMRGDALTCAEAFQKQGGEFFRFEALPRHTDIIVDGIFGTGLEREVAGRWRDALEAINRHRAPVLALDIPSGLNSDTGLIMGEAVRAQATISFVGLKQGAFTGEGPGCCGGVYFDSLDVPPVIYSSEIPASRRLDWLQQSSTLSPRPRQAHKGDFGHLLVVGGATGYSGAARLAGEAAARAGAGLVSIATHPAHALLLDVVCPELMCKGVESADSLTPFLERASVVAIGPGLGRSRWSTALLERVLDEEKPLVVDADALNLLAAAPVHRKNWILTPHPGEAARMLGCGTPDILGDRFSAAAELQHRYGGVVVLKGAGTLVRDDSSRPAGVCSDGNPGMASGGMGDTLTGIIGGLVAQGFDLGSSAELGVCLHGAAADHAAHAGERGLMAHDLLPEVRRLINPEATSC
ncbi:MAG: NAD(P)H-hydrate dehydratase [Gammaproteobacteria bacterium]|nr:NAD(P)H-hydrate dehydratase [Gammaproteobacteria bacterium]